MSRFGRYRAAGRVLKQRRILSARPQQLRADDNRDADHQRYVTAAGTETLTAAQNRFYSLLERPD